MGGWLVGWSRVFQGPWVLWGVAGLQLHCAVFALDVVAENGVEVVGGERGDGSWAFCRFRHCSSRWLGMSAGGKRNLVL